jgi:hypothetical protein
MRSQLTKIAVGAQEHLLQLYDIQVFLYLARSTQHACHDITLDHFVEVTIVACSNHSFVTCEH